RFSSSKNRAAVVVDSVTPRFPLVAFEPREFEPRTRPPRYGFLSPPEGTGEVVPSLDLCRHAGPVTRGRATPAKTTRRGRNGRRSPGNGPRAGANSQDVV